MKYRMIKDLLLRQNQLREALAACLKKGRERPARAHSKQRNLHLRIKLLPISESSQSTMRKLLLATNNQGKIREIKTILAHFPLELLTIAQVSGIPSPEDIKESGATFAENATIKARTLAGATNLLTLADDSGLEVDALGGKPGVHSARFVGGPDETRYSRVLELLKG